MKTIFPEPILNLPKADITFFNDKNRYKTI